MRQEDIRKWIRKNLEPLKKKFGLKDWTIIILYSYFKENDFSEPGDVEYRMMIDTNPRYKEASIEIDPRTIPNKTALRKTLEHELCHILHSPFDVLWESAKKYFPNRRTYNAMLEVYNNACELTVMNIENLL